MDRRNGVVRDCEHAEAEACARRMAGAKGMVKRAAVRVGGRRRTLLEKDPSGTEAWNKIGN